MAVYFSTGCETIAWPDLDYVYTDGNGFFELVGGGRSGNCWRARISSGTGSCYANKYLFGATPPPATGLGRITLYCEWTGHVSADLRFFGSPDAVAETDRFRLVSTGLGYLMTQCRARIEFPQGGLVRQVATPPLLDFDVWYKFSIIYFIGEGGTDSWAVFEINDVRYTEVVDCDLRYGDNIPGSFNVGVIASTSVYPTNHVMRIDDILIDDEFDPADYKPTWLPETDKVVKPTLFGLDLEGTHECENLNDPSEGDVRKTVVFGRGLEFEGNLALTTADNLRRDVGIGANGTEVIGNITLTAAENLLLDVGIGSNGTEVVGTHECEAIPDPVADADVRFGTLNPGTGGTGLIHVPAPGKVALDEPVDQAQGTRTDCPVAAAVLDTKYGDPDAQFTGTHECPDTYIPPLAITTASLPAGIYEVAYSAALAATGGVPPYTWHLISGSLPPGLTLAPTGAVTGTPGMPGAFSLVATVTDAGGQTNARLVTLTITGMIARLPNRQFVHLIKLYRNSAAKAASGRVLNSWTYQREVSCLWFPKGGDIVESKFGRAFQCDAIAWIDPSEDVRPQKAGEEPDLVEFEGQQYYVRNVRNAGGTDRYLIAQMEATADAL